MVTVLGAGSWGTALAKLLGEKGIDTILWARDKDLVQEMKQTRENSRYLPGYILPETVQPISSLKGALEGSDVLVFVVPAQVTRDLARKVSKIAASGLGSHLPRAVCCASKGIEIGSLCTMSQVLEEELPTFLHGKVAILSGPSFAQEVAAGKPAAVTIASSDIKVAEEIQELFSTDYFRAYSSLDLVGVQLGGALKNVLAIAAGIADGMGFGDNARAALITRGLAEMARLGVRCGANPITFAGLAGMGDLVLTCTGALSRNRHVGMKLGQGLALDQILTEMNNVAEGVKTAEAAYKMGQKYGVELPISEAVYQVLYEGLDPGRAVKQLMSRPLRTEFGSVFAP